MVGVCVCVGGGGGSGWRGLRVSKGGRVGGWVGGWFWHWNFAKVADFEV